ncbi:hypothetical protein IFM89_017324 [Coptis chinensis]|uniref:RING-type domain-containing protein n=1 Tax=Coptis chinensis TaxID=261450 RepID=A0A835H4I6_9MAGN|nr:hypothetical protein IFM89_017324 [Coptis chinensis]
MDYLDDFSDIEQQIVRETVWFFLSFATEGADLMTLQERITWLATLRAGETGDFKSIRAETERSVYVSLARELERTNLLSVTILDSDVCAICREDMVEGEEAGSFECLHIFHVKCMHEWIMKKPNCPMCRFEREVA